MTAIEANFDGLVGPTHHYGGLAAGNVASKTNAQTISNPRKAALQGLDKMKLLDSLGIVQFILPPPLRPNQKIYNELIKDVAELSVLFSASYMWRANAATVTPSADSKGKVHFTAANLINHRHRAQECAETAGLLQAVFSDSVFFKHHPPLPSEPRFADEGAANHMRIAASHGAEGVNIFVYGKDIANPDFMQPQKYQPRATRQAEEWIAKHHRLETTRTILVQQHPDAVDAGVFHNDVIAMSNEYVLIAHEQAYVHQKEFIAQVKSDLPELLYIEVPARAVPLDMAVKTYLFNSQLLTLADGSMLLLAPKECEEDSHVAKWIDALIADDKNPVNRVIYSELRESMKNGGGPACLRFRVTLTETELAAVNQKYRYTPELHAKLMREIDKHYREKLELADLQDLDFAKEAWAATRAIATCFK